MKDRAVGIENEFGVMLKDDFGNFSSQENEMLAINSIPRENLPQGGGMSNGRFWLANGGSVYIDLGHPEYASPECLRLRDLIAVSRAGERICSRMFHYAVSNGRYWQLFKNNLEISAEGGEGNSFGCHENYLIHGYKPEDEVMHTHLLPFLITRQILDGAGWWASDGRFSFSQRALILGTVAAMGTTEGISRPIINLRDEPHIQNREGMSRLHLILGDANMLDWALYLKFGTTSLVLAMLEEGHIFRDTCQNPIEAMRRVAFDKTARKRLLKFSGRGKMSALEVQEFYLAKAEKYVSITDFASYESRLEALQTVCMWREALNAIKNRDTAWMLGRLDWATKLYLGNKEWSNKKNSGASEMDIKKRVDILYHAVTDTRLRDRIYAKWPNRQLVGGQEIEYMINNPPLDTRARIRALFIDLCSKKQFGTDKDISVNWSKIVYRGKAFNLGYPLDKDNLEVEKLIRNLL
ncbi:MAG: proteasome accessory factor PafA2 family protein [Candidatus Spechtbacterales bacterium]